MKQKNLSVLTLLASLMLLIFSGSAIAATSVTFEPKTLIHDCVDTLTVSVNADDPINCYDMVAEIATATGGAFGTLAAVYLNYGDGSDISMVDGSSPDVFRFYGCDLGGGDIIPAGSDVLVQLVVTASTATGTFTIGPSSYDVYPGVFTAEPGFVSGCDFTDLTVNAGTYTVINTDPYFTNCPSLISATCADGTIQFDFDADDDDCGTTLTYSLGPSTGGSINTSSGLYEINVSQMCGNYSFQVIVTDEHGAQAACNFDLFVDDEAPYFTACPTVGSVTSILWGYTASGSVDAEDPDLCPATLEYTLCGINGPGPFPGTFDLNSTNGDWSWDTEELDEYVGVWEICIEASDGCKSAQCTFDITVLPTYRVKIEKIEDQYQGHYSYVTVSLTDTTDYIGGFDFLISYDASALTFMEAILSDDLQNPCGWEYFTYRTLGNCGSACPSGLVRVVGMAEMNNGPYHPNCFSAGPIDLFDLKFYVTNDRTFDCMFIPIGFYWLDCGDNTISSVSGDTLWISRYVYAYGDPPYLLDPAENPFIAGWQSIVPAVACDEDPDGDGPKEGPLVGVDFWDGGIDIACADSIDLRGDLNLNNVANEIADAVLYTNYFIYGLGVFDINPEGQIAASDVNNDGRILTVGDLVYLTRIITGDALPYPKMNAYGSTADVIVGTAGDVTTVSSSSNVDVGAALFVFNVNGNAQVTSLVKGMDMKSDIVNGELRVLVYSIGNGRIPAGASDLISVESDGYVELVESDFSDYYGNLMTTNTSAKVLPKNFSLNQNFPNPFNPSTEITIDVPGQSDWKLDIYNVTGQLIKSFSGYTSGGRVSVTWDASDAASGIYFYKATVGQYSDVKKMVLMK